MNDTYNFYASSPKAIEDLLAAELKEFGATDIKLTISGVYFTGTLETAYRTCLYSRIANRVYLILKKFEVPNKDVIYEEASQINWGEHLLLDNTFAVTCTITTNRFINHTHYGALIIKDAIVDYFRETYGKRPSIQKKDPDIQIHIHLDKENATISLDLSGDSLHKRGYREIPGPATLKENVAAAILLRSGWKEIAANGGSFIDPMCGTGTLPIEAAMIAADIAPGLLRKSYGFMKWQYHREDIWTKLRQEAEGRKEEGLKKIPRITGYDRDRLSAAAALKNIDCAGLTGYVHVEKRDMLDVKPTAKTKTGLLAVNPPYGQRLGDKDELISFYSQFGAMLQENFGGWHAALITEDDKLAKNVGLKASKVNTVYNGALKCVLAQFKIFSEEERAKARDEAKARPLNPQAQMFANRLKKNLRLLKKWLKKEGITSYRLYDADMPEYSAAIDYYEGKWVSIQEYAPPATIPEHTAMKRLTDIRKGVIHVLDVHPGDVFIKQRKKQSGKNQYDKMNSKQKYIIINESGLKFNVNFTDYLDTGIFLDHRPIRRMIKEKAAGKTFLNLFAYTGTASVYAAAGGAVSTTTVDKSKTYLEWARDNMTLNDFTGAEHRFVKDDCITYLIRESKYYDLIFLDPPTFSNSKDTKDTFDVQRDHVKLIKLAADRLAPGGVLIFSNNFRKFKMDHEALKEFAIEDITAQTIPRDYERNKRIHNCWLITQN